MDFFLSYPKTTSKPLLWLVTNTGASPSLQTFSHMGVIRIKIRYPWSDGNIQQKSHENEKANQVWWNMYVTAAVRRQRRGASSGSQGQAGLYIENFDHL